MKLIISCGLPGAGKEEFLNAVRDLGIGFVRMGDVVREAYADRPEEFRYLSIGQMAAKYRELEGADCWAKRTIRKAEGNVFVIDGCRSMNEIEMFRKYSDEVIIIGIFASPRTRYERLIKRARDDAPHNIDEFRERDEREISWGSSKTLSLADILLVNECTREEFIALATKVLKEVSER